MKAFAISAALLTLVGSTAVASAQSGSLYVPVDSMQRDGNHSGRLGGPYRDTPYYLYTGRSAAQDVRPRYVEPNEDGGYSYRGRPVR